MLLRRGRRVESCSLDHYNSTSSGRHVDLSFRFDVLDVASTCSTSVVDASRVARSTATTRSMRRSSPLDDSRRRGRRDSSFQRVEWVVVGGRRQCSTPLVCRDVCPPWSAQRACVSRAHALGTVEPIAIAGRESPSSSGCPRQGWHIDQIVFPPPVMVSPLI